ncbi:inner membrane protein YqjE [Klebsiella grimontii]|uniref:Inner membrane protein YqjE n=1 Tax=Klebsiella grimontii TaxID=2058152 RepID=A0A7H4NW77_9ENTR|nr:inner membrane protein YqjE [Klebsiella grimontii]
MVETRLRLVVVELEEEKANLFQLFLMLGLTLLFAAFGLMSLLVLIIWAVDAQYRLNVMIATTVILLLAALIGGIWTLRKGGRSTFLRLTRQELANDRHCWRMTSHEPRPAGTRTAKGAFATSNPTAAAGSQRQPPPLA